MSTIRIGSILITECTKEEMLSLVSRYGLPIDQQPNPDPEIDILLTRLAIDDWLNPTPAQIQEKAVQEACEGLKG